MNKLWLTFALALAVGALLLPSLPLAASGSLHANITCEPLGSGAYYCEAFPQESGLSYSWSRTGPISMSAAGAVNLVTCTSQFANANLFVTITDASGQSSSDNQQIDCTPFGIIGL